MVLTNVLLIEELRRDDEGVAAGWAGLLRGVLDGAVVPRHIAPHSVKDDDGAGHSRLRLGPIEGDEKRLVGRTMRRRYAESLTGHLGRAQGGGVRRDGGGRETARQGHDEGATERHQSGTL